MPQLYIEANSPSYAQIIKDLVISLTQVNHGSLGPFGDDLKEDLALLLCNEIEIQYRQQNAILAELKKEDAKNNVVSISKEDKKKH